MATVSKEAAERVWMCHREIAAGEKLLYDMAEQMMQDEPAKYQQTLKDAFGRRRCLQLGIPSGDDCHRLVDVSPELALTIVRAHIARKQSELVEASEACRVELSQ